MTSTLTELAWASRILADAVKDRSYRATPLGLVVGRYYRWKKNEWGATEATLRDYEAPLRDLCLKYAHLEVKDFEPPVGTERIREFWDEGWSDRSPRTRAKILSIIRDFFRWAQREGLIHGDPTMPIRAPKKRHDRRDQAFPEDVVRRILAAQEYPADRIGVRLIDTYGLRRGELAGVRLKHFDFERRCLTVFGKGGKTRVIPIGDEHLWRELGELRVLGLTPDHFLLYRQDTRRRRLTGDLESAEEILDVPGVGRVAYARTVTRTHYPLSNAQSPSGKAVHLWWYRCLERAGLVDVGQTSGMNMHRGRHTAATNVIRRANLKYAQQLLGHESITTTADIYGHLDTSDLARVLRDIEEG